MLDAINLLEVDRIGHGYRAFYIKEGDNPDLADKVRKLLKSKDIHLEMCLTSSWLLQSAPSDKSQHPVKSCLEDDFSCSLSTDDPGVMVTDIPND